ncbi:hypothetical protein V6x_08230 [Gimesia chilikensis]|uniref:DUF1569 domain-containing protein n=2 Tax=Gimesia chilikensis TaxID=2605989 RepID=A0A517W7A9_9PLAN|nr:hypothetical protein V6x_08230 [Gimesia chilikensis]
MGEEIEETGAMIEDLRELKFERLEDAVAEVESLLRTGYTQRGKWNLAQICRHLSLVQDPALDGYPKWMLIYAPLWPVMRRLFLPRLLKGDSPQGIPTTPIFVPAADLADAVEAEHFAQSVTRFKAHEGPYHWHPGFGRLDRETLETVYTTHAAHHLRFLEPQADG